MKRLLGILAAGILLSLCSPTSAQQANNYWCNSATVPCPPSGWVPASSASPLPVTASVSASINGFHPESSLTPITATTGGVSSSSFTSGKSILVQNVGTTNAAYCFPGNSATTSSEYIPAGGSALITTTAETVITCATSTSTTTINFQVGTGLWTGAGAGSGSGGGLSVTDQASWTQGTSPFAPSGGVFNDTATLTSGQQGTYRMTTKRAQIMDVDTSGNALYSALTAAIPAGANIIGKVGIDQTTPGTTNGVQINAALPAGTNVVGFTSNDPCAQATKLGAPISLTASGQVITGAASKKTYICSIDIVSATAQNIALVEGTGSTCATNIFGLAGGTTAATGWNFSANGGLTKGGGAGTVYSPSADTNATAANLCLLLSSTGQTSGQITYVQQ